MASAYDDMLRQLGMPTYDEVVNSDMHSRAVRKVRKTILDLNGKDGVRKHFGVEVDDDGNPIKFV